ncbi:MAG: YtxH domain-containing protein, partial [Silvibacterium sp.]
MSEENQSSGFSWFLAGLGIGALVGVLFAPKAGKETRENLASSAREGSEYLRQRSREAADQMNQFV